MADTTRNDADGFTEVERDAIKERAKELKANARRGSKADPEADVLAKIAEMPDADRVLAERVHAIVMSEAPDLSPKLWYGQPAYAKGGDVVCFFQAASKFKTRYATLGFNEAAKLDDGSMWPTSFAIVELTESDQKTLRALVRKAAS